jgi:hypothetical protein
LQFTSCVFCTATNSYGLHHAFLALQVVSVIALYLPLETQAAKEILIKAVAQALPVYIMGVFKIPFGLCDELTQMIRDYWWGKEDGKRKMHWIFWDNLLRPKCRGGIGFKDLRLFNQALLAREGCSFVVCCIDFRPVFR